MDNYVTLGTRNIVRRLSRNNTLKRSKDQTLYGSEEELSVRRDSIERDSDNLDSEYMGSDGSDGSSLVGFDPQFNDRGRKNTTSASEGGVGASEMGDVNANKDAGNGRRSNGRW